MRKTSSTTLNDKFLTPKDACKHVETLHIFAESLKNAP